MNNIVTLVKNYTYMDMPCMIRIDLNPLAEEAPENHLHGITAHVNGVYLVENESIPNGKIDEYIKKAQIKIAEYASSNPQTNSAVIQRLVREGFVLGGY